VPSSFAVTWDYRCPFARNAHEHVLAGLADGADWDVTFLPFSLSQVHVEEGQPDVWDNPETDSGLMGLQVAVAVRDSLPERFPAVHRALFTHRHEQGGSLRDQQALGNILKAHDIDADSVLAEVSSGRPLATIKAEHTAFAASHDVWGVPTFIVGDQAAFVRLMHRPEGDAAVAREAVERVIGLLGWADLNEFKHTSIPN
jgi:hypothetical protein